MPDLPPGVARQAWDAAEMTGHTPPKPMPIGGDWDTHFRIQRALPTGNFWFAEYDDEEEDLGDCRAEADEQHGHPVTRSQWAPADCRCPWPWPFEGKHVHLDCPHYVPESPVRIAATLDGCHQTDGTWIHGRPHDDCPKRARG